MTKILAEIPPYTFDQSNGSIESNTCVLLSLLNTSNFVVSCDPTSDKTYYIDINELLMNWKEYNPDKSLEKVKPKVRGMKTKNALSNKDSLIIYQYLSGLEYANASKEDLENLTFKFPLTTTNSQTVLNKNTYEKNTTDCVVTVSPTFHFMMSGPNDNPSINSILNLLSTSGPVRFGHNNPLVALQLATATGPYDSDGFLIIDLPVNDLVYDPIDKSKNRYNHAITLVGIEIVSSKVVKFYCVDTYGETNKKFVIQYTSSDIDIDLNAPLIWPVVYGASRVSFTIKESIPESCCEVTPTPTPTLATPTPTPTP